MNELVGGLYEIKEKIGAGGGGIVYLGRHIRLDKTVVLKADKRTLKAGEAVLRREVDMLKGLSHTYIPQVYDFIEENGIVYTVMDYIEGESFDKILKREGKQNQVNVIKWACQLLEALSYLHRQGEFGILHGDIKPANIMLKPDGNICLIDFNIALALGEDGAVKVGFSRGYASPEHYGSDYIEGVSGSDITMVDTDSRKLLKKSLNMDSELKSGRRQILLDARSDIYSLGATLYHILSGVKPNANAGDVLILGKEVCNEEISKILKKAMAAIPDERFQTADEMLEAFLNLRKSDKRVLRRKRNHKIILSLFTLFFLFGGSLTYMGMERTKNREKAIKNANLSLDFIEKGEYSEALLYAMKALPKKDFLNPEVSAEAKRAISGALRVYDLSDGYHEKKTIDLSSVPFKIKISPKRQKYAILSAYKAEIFNENDELIISLSLQESAFSDLIFIDEENILYSGQEGVTKYNIQSRKLQWQGEEGINLVLSGDGKTLASVNKKKNGLIFYEVSSGEKVYEKSFGEHKLDFPSNDIFADNQVSVLSLNKDASFFSVRFEDGGLSLFWRDKNSQNDIDLYEVSALEYLKCGFSNDLFVLSEGTEKEERLRVFRLSEEGEFLEILNQTDKNRFFIQTDETGIYIAQNSTLVKIEIENMGEREMAYLGDALISDFYLAENRVAVKADDEKLYLFDENAKLLQTYEPKALVDFVGLSQEKMLLGNRDERRIKLLKVEKHSDKTIFKFDSNKAYDEARVSPLEDRGILYDYQSFSVYDLKGKLINETKLPDSKNIYDEQFVRKDGKAYLEVIWYDGKVRHYSLEKGELLKEFVGEKPRKDLYEEFTTSKFRVKSQLHEEAEFYDLKTDKLIKKFPSKDYLTYITETDFGIIAEFISTDGKRYGYLLDEKLNIIADFPALTDVYDNTLVFDYKNGELRQTSIFSMKDLIDLGEDRMKLIVERKEE